MINASDKLHEQVCGALETLDLPDEDTLTNIVKTLAAGLGLVGYTFTEEEIDFEIKRIQSQFVHRMGLGALFEAEDYAPWLKDRQGDINWYYWGRYKKYLLIKKGFSKYVVNALDSTSDTILDHTENPLKEGSWARKGLVVGDVQSGKTANYTGLICKAADSGYKVIIVLAGMLNTLRNQTQKRLDNDFMGWCTIKHQNIGSSIFSIEKRHPVCFTTAIHDFQKSSAQKIAMALDNINDAIIFVVKKNKSSLANLYDWLVTNNRYNLQKYSMLMIDDEADHASINTNKEDASPTAINLAIRNLLSIFDRSSLVGYTATPFANIFIDPETEDEMINGEPYRDLFPKDFIFSLDPPTNYIGPRQIFSDDESNNFIKPVDDNEDILPPGHKKDFEPVCLPGSLMIAVRCFIIARAIRLIRGQQNKNHTMLINVSRFIKVQEIVKGLVLEYVKELRQAVNNYCGQAVETALRNTLISDLHSTWAEEFRSVIGWASLQPLLKEAIDPAVVICVNTTSSDVLSYDEGDYPQGRTLLVVGGLALSRGLTLEGLMVSYFLRNSIMYDTLMQMGRWFGYRDEYEELCRVFLTETTSTWYSYIAESSEELRKEIKEMSQAGLTPLEFGLRVRTHPESLIVTARNKMRSARMIPVQISLAGRLAETSVVHSGEALVRQNMDVIHNAVQQINSSCACQQADLGFFWRGVSSDIVKRAIENYQNHPMSLRTYHEPLVNFLHKLSADTCDVLLRSVQQNEGGRYNVNGFEINLPNRTAAVLNDKYVEFSKRRVASRGDESAGIPERDVLEIKKSFGGKSVPDKEYRKYRMLNSMPPLFMIQIVRVSDKSNTKSLIVPCFGLSFPGDPGNARRLGPTVEYVVNTTWWNMNFQNEYEEEEDEQ